MATRHFVRSPIQWGWDEFKSETAEVGSGAPSIAGSAATRRNEPIVIRRIETADLKDALLKGFDDFTACRTDVIFLCLIYPLLGLILFEVFLGQSMLPLIFPLASGFVLLGPVAAVGIYEMSHRREQGFTSSWADAFSVVQSPARGAIMVLSLVLLAIFLAWLAAAYGLFLVTLGPQPPASALTFLHDVFATGAGWSLIGAGVGVGFLFAVVVLTIGVVSFPLLIERDVGVSTAMWTSARVVAANPGPMAAWGLIVAGSLVVGSIPLLLGLAVVMPVLGHATWHLYRKVVAPISQRALAAPNRF